MRKVLAVVALFLSSSAVVAAQQHAALPKEAQCRADADAWVGDKAAIANLPMQELLARHDSLMDCAKADPSWTSTYRAVGDVYKSAIFDRLADFLKRHDLWKQVLAEDAAGQR